MRVGWIGLGRVGRQMALAALAGGHSVAGHSREFARHEDVERAGGLLCSSVAEAVAGAEVVCVNVYSEEQLREVMFDGGAVEAMQPGAVLVVHSTVSPAAIAELASARSDVHVLDAGFSGTAEDVSSGRLTLMVGGHGDALARVEPVLRCYADTIAHLGPSGAGMTVKIINNLLFAAQMSLGYEALSIAAESGVVVGDAVAVLQQGSAASFALGAYGKSGDLPARLEQTRPYLEKDVAIGLNAFPGLAEIKAATRRFVP